VERVQSEKVEEKSVLVIIWSFFNRQKKNVDVVLLAW